MTEFSPSSEFQRANQLALELGVWLPPELYAMVGRAINGGNIFDVLFEIRGRYGHSTPLDPDTVFIHAPGIGKEKL